MISGDYKTRGKTQKKEYNERHRIQLAVGVEQEGNGKRHRLVGKREFVNTDFAKVQMQVERFLESYYNFQKTVVICNSDNGAGYVRSSFENMAGECGQFEFFVDPYHVNRKVKTRLSFAPKGLQDDVLRVLRQFDREKVEGIPQYGRIPGRDEGRASPGLPPSRLLK